MKKSGKQYVDIPLDIAVEYPIGWSFEKAIRDFVQNFYDAIGAESFHEGFNYQYNLEKNGTYTLVMSMEGHSFSYDLLAHIGASTKRNDNRYIGKYGEGFKMASLCIYKMCGMSVVMHSKDWSISPASYYEQVGDASIEMFGYKLDKASYDGRTSLTISGIPSNKKKALKECLMEFFFPENELIGDLIGNGEHYDVYYRSSVPIPCKEHLDDQVGILFLNNLARGRIPFPIVVNYKNQDFSDTRSRPTLSPFDTTAWVYGCMEFWDAGTSAAVLRLLKKYWNQIPTSNNNPETKYYYICQLVRNVVRDKEIAASFQAEMGMYCYLPRATADNVFNTRINEARRWWDSNGDKKLINPVFRLLGAESVLDRYAGRDIASYREATECEKNRYMIAAVCAASISKALDEDSIPDVVIDEDVSQKHSPLQFAVRTYDKDSKKRGAKYRIDKMVMKTSDFKDDAFFDTFLYVADAFLHVYGTAKSEKHNVKLTHLASGIARGHEALNYAADAWRSVGKGGV